MIVAQYVNNGRLTEEEKSLVARLRLEQRQNEISTIDLCDDEEDEVAQQHHPGEPDFANQPFYFDFNAKSYN